MNSGTINRRKLLVAATGAGLGTSISAPAQQSAQSPKFPYPPKDSGGFHNDTMNRIASTLEGKSINTRDGLLKIVDMLRELGVVNEADAQVLRELIGAIFSSSTLETLAATIEKLYRESMAKVGQVTAAIVSIARASVEDAKKYAQDNPRQIYIVSSDVVGALAGAAAGAKLGVVFAVIGALAGAVGTSAKAAFETKR